MQITEDQRNPVASQKEIDEVLLRQTRENKLSPAFEPEPYKVIQKEGNTVVIENSEGDRKMRNVAHLKKQKLTAKSLYSKTMACSP